MPSFTEYTEVDINISVSDFYSEMSDDDVEKMRELMASDDVPTESYNIFDQLFYKNTPVVEILHDLLKDNSGYSYYRLKDILKNNSGV